MCREERLSSSNFPCVSPALGSGGPAASSPAASAAGSSETRVGPTSWRRCVSSDWTGEGSEPLRFFSAHLSWRRTFNLLPPVQGRDDSDHGAVPVPVRHAGPVQPAAPAEPGTPPRLLDHFRFSQILQQLRLRGVFIFSYLSFYLDL